MSEAEHSPLAAWMREYGPRLWRVAHAFARDDDEAEDLLQDMWLVALRRQHTLRNDAAVGAWLHRILLNIGRSRRRKVARRASLVAMWAKSDWIDKNRVEAAASLSEEHVRTVLWREIGELPGLQREVLLLRLVEGMSTPEAAHAIRRAEGTVKASLHRALKRLESRLRAQGVDPSVLGGW